MEELYRKIVLGLFLSLVFVGCKQTSDMLEVNFKTPPEQIQTSVYWYWIAGNISEEGVVKDLYAMKQAGINRAFIGCIGDESMKSHPARGTCDTARAGGCGQCQSGRLPGAGAFGQCWRCVRCASAHRGHPSGR